MRDGRQTSVIMTLYKPWIFSCRWLLLRRLTQLSVLGLFLLGPLAGIWIAKGNLNSSLILNVLPLTDPYVLMQSLFAGHTLKITAVSGALIVAVFYILVGGRVYCAWICPINIITDIAAWCRKRLGIKGNGIAFGRNTRYWILVLTLLLALLTGTIVWELVNPVSMVFRGIVFGIGMSWIFILAIFLFDLFISRRGWCGHLCPVGAFYSLFGKISIIRVSAANRSQCNDCMDCFNVCPEPQVIKPALKGVTRNTSPVILSPNCTNCARCIDVCSRHVFKIATRFNTNVSTHSVNTREAVT